MEFPAVPLVMLLTYMCLSFRTDHQSNKMEVQPAFFTRTNLVQYIMAAQEFPLDLSSSCLMNASLFMANLSYIVILLA